MSLDCKQCGTILDEETYFRYYRQGNVAICDRCADIVANWYNHWHGGYFLTWTDPDRVTKKRPPQVSESIRWEIFNRDGFECRTCGTSHRLTVDHIIPPAQGGTDDTGNLQTLCRSCNARKGKTIAIAATGA